MSDETGPRPPQRKLWFCLYRFARQSHWDGPWLTFAEAMESARIEWGGPEEQRPHIRMVVAVDVVEVWSTDRG